MVFPIFPGHARVLAICMRWRLHPIRVNSIKNMSPRELGKRRLRKFRASKAKKEERIVLQPKTFASVEASGPRILRQVVKTIIATQSWMVDQLFLK
jgi:hypothetical protein